MLQNILMSCLSFSVYNLHKHDFIFVTNWFKRREKQIILRMYSASQRYVASYHSILKTLMCLIFYPYVNEFILFAFIYSVRILCRCGRGLAGWLRPFPPPSQFYYSIAINPIKFPSPCAKLECKTHLCHVQHHRAHYILIFIYLFIM